MVKTMDLRIDLEDIKKELWNPITEELNRRDKKNRVRLDFVDLKTGALEYNLDDKYDEEAKKIVEKHYDRWLKKHGLR